MREYNNTEIIDVETITINPELARNMINKSLSIRSTGNRNLMQSVVRRYADEMKNGRWRLTHQGIAISSDGYIYDGQHRLHAIVESGASVKMQITVLRGADSALLTPIDIGKPRKTSEILGIDRRIIEVVKCIAKLFFLNTHEPSNMMCEALYESFRSDLDWFGSFGQTTRKDFSTAPIRACVILRHAMGVDWMDEYDNLIKDKFERFAPVTAAMRRYLETNARHSRFIGTPDRRRMQFAVTWKASDPDNRENTRLIIRDPIDQIQNARQWLSEKLDIGIKS